MFALGIDAAWTPTEPSGVALLDVPVHGAPRPIRVGRSYSEFIPQNMERSAEEAIPGFGGGSSCCMILKSQAMDILGRELDKQGTFRFSGMD